MHPALILPSIHNPHTHHDVAYEANQGGGAHQLMINLSFGSKNTLQNYDLSCMAIGCEVKPEGLGRPQAGGGAKRNPCLTMI